MYYKNVNDEEYKGFEISIYEMKRVGFMVDVKKPCGELIASRCDMSTFIESEVWAQGFVDGFIEGRPLLRRK